MKINPIELKQIIKEEATRLKRRMMLESEKAAILKQLQEIEESYLEEAQLDEVDIFGSIGQGLQKGMQKVTNAFTKAYTLDGKYLPSSKNKMNVSKYGKAVSKLMALGLSELQAQEAAAILLDNNQMGSYANGHITPTYDAATKNIKFASTAAISSNPNPVGVGEQYKRK